MQEIGQYFFYANFKRLNIILVKVLMQLFFIHILKERFKVIFLFIVYLCPILQHYKNYECLQYRK